MDITSDLGPIVAITHRNCGGEAGACGDCTVCARKASLTVASLAIEWRYTRRGRAYPSGNGEEQRYIRNLAKRTLAVLGLPGGEDPLCPACERVKEPLCALCADIWRGGRTGPTAQSEPGPPTAAQQY